MAKQIGDPVMLTELQTIKSVQITSGAELAPADRRIDFQFENGRYDSAGKLDGSTWPGVWTGRRFGDIKDDIYEAGEADGVPPIQATGAQIAVLIKKAGERYRDQDAEARAAEIAAQHQPPAPSRAEPPGNAPVNPPSA